MLSVCLLLAFASGWRCRGSTAVARAVTIRMDLQWRSDSSIYIPPFFSVKDILWLCDVFNGNVVVCGNMAYRVYANS